MDTLLNQNEPLRLWFSTLQEQLRASYERAELDINGMFLKFKNDLYDPLITDNFSNDKSELYYTIHEQKSPDASLKRLQKFIENENSPLVIERCFSALTVKKLGQVESYNKQRSSL